MVGEYNHRKSHKVVGSTLPGGDFVGVSEELASKSTRSDGRVSHMNRTASFAAVIILLMVSACSGSGGKTYDIAPIFPLSADKCAKYHGDEKGQGITASCMVTKAECEAASADWRQAMRSSGVDDAIQFSCD